jgi:L-2,4-diaminobutyric acid acetyltransferase
MTTTEAATLERGDARPATAPDDDLRIRTASMADGAAVHRLVVGSEVLDVNSSYAYLLFLDRFGATSVVAETDDEGIVGFVTGFRPPESPDVIFVWQVAVDATMRGRGLARRMLDTLVGLEACRGVRFLETTVTPTNAPSRALFASFARGMDAEHTVSPYIEAGMFPEPGHEDEELHRIGPF